jgi:hypothetical protein
MPKTASEATWDESLTGRNKYELLHISMTHINRAYIANADQLCRHTHTHTHTHKKHTHTHRGKIKGRIVNPFGVS